MSSSNIKEQDRYSAIGNLQKTVNSNMQEFNVRTCDVDKNIDAWRSNFQDLSSLIPKLESFASSFQETSAFLKSASDIVYNFENYWLPNIGILYVKPFSVIANYQDIEKWLDSNFIDVFHKNQILSVNFAVHSYDPTILNGTPIQNITTETLDSLAISYQLTATEIKDFVVKDNLVNSIISIINSIFNRIKIGMTVKNNNDLFDIYSKITSFRGILNTTQFIIDQENLKVIYSLLNQYALIHPVYTDYANRGAKQIPELIISKFDLKNIYTHYFHSFCFKQNSDKKWKYLPDCYKENCKNQPCDDCYDALDVNDYYENSDCVLGTKFVLRECANVVKNPTLHYFNISEKFTIPTGGVLAKIKAWGSRGGGDYSPEAYNDPRTYGGGGGYSYGEFEVSENQVYSVEVAKFGGKGIINVITSGGGLCGVFSGQSSVDIYSFNRALLIAGGGGGALASETGTVNSGNTQFANGLPGNSTDPNISGGSASMEGIKGTGSNLSNDIERAAGGGGYRGGTRTIASNGTIAKGGTGYVHSDAANPIITAGAGIVTANNAELLSTSQLINKDIGGVVIEIHYDTNFILD